MLVLWAPTPQDFMVNCYSDSRAPLWNGEELGPLSYQGEGWLCVSA